MRMKGNARGQAVAAMEEAVKAVEALGGAKEGIGRVRMFVNVSVIRSSTNHRSRRVDRALRQGNWECMLRRKSEFTQTIGAMIDAEGNWTRSWCHMLLLLDDFRRYR